MTGKDGDLSRLPKIPGESRVDRPLTVRGVAA
jgi:hypothetical protein